MLTDEQRNFAISKYEGGSPPSRIAEILGVSIQVVVMAARRAGCPAQFPNMAKMGRKSARVRWQKRADAEKNEMKREMTRNKQASGINFNVSGGQTDRDARVLIDQIPPDTRDITGRVFGDPLPGRRALDRRQSA